MADDITQLRLRLLANGYVPIRNRDKRTFMVGWPKAEITPAEIERWSRKFKRDTATGLRLGDGLGTIDFDIDDADAMLAIYDAVLDAVPALDNADLPLLRRTGSGFKEAWFVRTDETFSRMFSRRWVRPGETADDGVHCVEIFGGGSPRQFGAFGPHTVTDDGEVLKSYGWIDRSPLDTPLAALPVLSKQQFSAVVDAVERTLERLGWSPVLRSAAGENDVTRVYDLTPGMMFDTNTGERLTLAELRALALTHDGLRCSASWLEPGAVNTSRCIVSTDHSDRLCIWESASGVTHMEPDAAPPPRPDLTELMTKLGKLSEQNGLKADPRPVAAPRASVADPRALHRIKPTDECHEAAGKMLKLYAYCPNNPRTEVVPIYAETPEAGFNLQALRTLYAANNAEEIGPRGGRVVISPADVWRNDRTRINVEGIRMRPDKEWPLYEEDGKLWVNCFKLPVHGEIIDAGSEAVFDAFMEHLMPHTIEREYVLDWMAHKWQHPEVPGCGVIMVAREQGSGRGTLFSMLTQLFGDRHIGRADGQTLTGEGSQGQYNRFLAGALLVLVDEVLSGPGAVKFHRQNTYERLKSLIDPAMRTTQIVQKQANNYDTVVYAGFLMATNHENALPLEEDDRRLCVIRNGEPMDDAMRALLAPYRRGGGWSEGFIAMLAYKLSSRDLSGYNAYAPPPVFPGKVTMIEQNSTDVQEVAEEVIAELPGDFVTRKAFLDRVRHKLGDAAREHKNINQDAVGRLSRRWVLVGRERVNDRDGKADVWARDKQAKARWQGSPYDGRSALLEPNNDLRRKLTSTQIEALALKLKVVKSDDEGEDGQ